MILTVAWTQRDRTLMLSDSYGYLNQLLVFLDRPDFDSPDEAWRAIGELGLAGRPPFYQLATIPVLAAFGPSPDAAVLVNLLFLALVAVATYHVGRIVRNREAGLLASLLVLTYPPIVHLSRTYLPHFALAAWCALNLWILLALIEKRSIGKAWLLGISVACGLWTHPYFACVAAAPTIVVGLYLLGSSGGVSVRPPKRDAGAWLTARLGDRFVLLGLLPAAGIAVASLVSWYGSWGAAGFEQLGNLSGGRQARLGFPGHESSPWWYAQTAPGAITAVLAAFTAIGCLYAFSKRRWQEALLAITLLSAYVLLSQGPVLGWVYFAAALPAAAVLGSSWIFAIRRRWLRRLLIAVAVGVASFSFGFVTWGGETWQRSLAVSLGSPLADGGTCSNDAGAALCPPPEPRWRWPWAEIRDRMSESSALGGARRPRVLVLRFLGTAPGAVSHALLSEDLNHFEVVRLGKRNKGQPYHFDRLLESEFVIYSDRIDERLHYDSATAKFLRSPPPAFAMAHRVVASFETPYPAIGTLRVMQRLRRLSARELEQSIAALELQRISTDLNRATIAEMYVAMADPHVRKGAYRAAIKPFRNALAASPEDLGLRLNLTYTYLKLGDRESAVRELSQAVARAPAKVRRRLNRARTYAKSAKTSEAIEEILRIAPGHGVEAPELEKLKRFERRARKRDAVRAAAAAER